SSCSSCTVIPNAGCIQCGSGLSAAIVRDVEVPPTLDSSPKGVDAGDVLTNNQRVNVVRSFVGVNALEIEEMSNHRVAVGIADRAENVARPASAFQRHPNVVALGQRYLRGAA